MKPRLKPSPRPAALKSEMLSRLRRAEGQLRGLQRLINEHAYCVDVLQQLAAVRRALDKLALLLVRDHLSTCVSEALQKPGGERGKIEELVGALDRFLA